MNLKIYRISALLYFIFLFADCCESNLFGYSVCLWGIGCSLYPSIMAPIWNVSQVWIC